MTPEQALFAAILFVIVALVVVQVFFWVLAQVAPRYVVIGGPEDDNEPGSELDENTGSEPPNEPNEPAEPASQTGSADGTRGSRFVFTDEEVHALAAMFRWREAERQRGRIPTKADSIQHGFGVSKGASNRYQRASQLYDIFCAPASGNGQYHPLDSQKKIALMD